MHRTRVSLALRGGPLCRRGSQQAGTQTQIDRVLMSAVCTGICILRSWFITDLPMYTSPMAPPRAAKPPAVPTLLTDTVNGRALDPADGLWSDYLGTTRAGGWCPLPRKHAAIAAHVAGGQVRPKQASHRHDHRQSGTG